MQIFSEFFSDFLQRCTGGPPQGRDNDGYSRVDGKCFIDVLYIRAYKMRRG